MAWSAQFEDAPPDAVLAQLAPRRSLGRVETGELSLDAFQFGAVGDALEVVGLSPELRTPPLPATHVRVGTSHRKRTRGYPDIGDIAAPLQEHPLITRDLVSHAHTESAFLLW